MYLLAQNVHGPVSPPPILPAKFPVQFLPINFRHIVHVAQIILLELCCLNVTVLMLHVATQTGLAC